MFVVTQMLKCLYYAKQGIAESVLIVLMKIQQCNIEILRRSRSILRFLYPSAYTWVSRSPVLAPKSHLGFQLNKAPVQIMVKFK